MKILKSRRSNGNLLGDVVTGVAVVAAVLEEVALLMIVIVVVVVVVEVT
jgi:hypothetical protein